MRKANRQTRVAICFLLPHMIGLLIFTVLPIFATLIISLFQWNLITAPKFVGFDNYISMLTEDYFFRQAMVNTFVYTLGSVILIVTLSLFVAVLINSNIRFKSFFRTMYFIPNISSLVAVSVIWMWIYNSDYGLLNNVLRSIGVTNPPGWLSDTHWSLLSVILMSSWTQIGFFTVIFIAGLQGIPKYLYEAAEIDGSTTFTTFRKITLPMLSPTTFFVLIMAIINSFQVFEQSYVMTKGGPSFSTTTAVMYIYDNAFKYQKMGYASAVSWGLFVCILAITIIQMVFQKKWVYYEV